jgi:hypothetical protein
MVVQSVSEIDLRKQATDVMSLTAGSEYLIMSSWSTLENISWEVAGDNPFEVKVKGVTFYMGFVPNPFNSDWEAAEANYGGTEGWYGMHRKDKHISLHVLVRTNASNLRLKFVSDWIPSRGIKIPF